MGKRKMDIDTRIRMAAEGIKENIARWQHIKEYGCNDPFWCDGCNMNLERNHVIYHKEKLESLCRENGRDLPEEYYLATPPEVDDNYMANLQQKKRVEMLRDMGKVFSRSAPSYQPEQMRLF